jgi:hypothetical protein
MQEVTVKRTELIEVVTKNRDAHRALFLKAQEGFRARAVEELDAMLAAARDGGALRLHVGLVAPEDHTVEYDRALQMLSMSQDDVVTIDQHSFAQLVRNEWAWFAHSSAVNATYASGLKVDAPGAR